MTALKKTVQATDRGFRKLQSFNASSIGQGMDATEFKTIRHGLGLSAQGMANALHVQAGRTVQRWEAGDREIPGPVAVLARLLATNFDVRTIVMGNGGS